MPCGSRKAKNAFQARPATAPNRCRAVCARRSIRSNPSPMLECWRCCRREGIRTAHRTRRHTRGEHIFAGGDGPLFPLLAEIFAALPLVETWDPLAGYAPSDNPLSLSPSPTAGFLLAAAGPRFHFPGHHRGVDVVASSVMGRVIPHAGKDKGAAGFGAFLFGVAYPLGLVERFPDDLLRLSAFGRHLLLGEAEPAAPPSFPQTLMVQPNAGNPRVPAGAHALTHCLANPLCKVEGHRPRLHARTHRGADLPRPESRADAADDRADTEPARHTARSCRRRGLAPTLGE